MQLINTTNYFDLHFITFFKNDVYEQSLLMAVYFLISRGRPVSIFCPSAQLGQYQPDRAIPPPNEKLRLVIPLPK
jgi:hypothetical protein